MRLVSAIWALFQDFWKAGSAAQSNSNCCKAFLKSVLPVKSLSMVSTTNFASSIVKHIGGLNLSTFLPGPSVLRRIYSSLSLERAVTELCSHFAYSSENFKSIIMVAVQTMLFSADWCNLLYLSSYWVAGCFETVCLSSTLQSHMIVACTLLLNTLLLLWLGSFWLDL